MLQMTISDIIVSAIGSDRAYRRYWLHQSVPGVFVEAGAEPRGVCRDKPVSPVVTLSTLHAPPADTLAYVKQLFENERGESLSA